MAPAKGNKHAVGYGRPPNPGFADEDLLKLGEELMQWMKMQDDDPRSDVVHLSEWYSEIKNISPTQWESICIRKCFNGYYDKARIWMGKRLLKNKDLHQSYGNRFLNIYFKDVKKEERESVEHKIDYELKKKAEMAVAQGLPPNDPNLDLILEAIKENKRLKQELDDLKSKTNPIISRSQ
jgi:hypothetical protein